VVWAWYTIGHVRGVHIPLRDEKDRDEDSFCSRFVLVDRRMLTKPGGRHDDYRT
jgi:hypothetical protein